MESHTLPMRILFLTPQLPYPPHQGTTIRNFNILKRLAARHEIHLLSFGLSTELADSPLTDYCHRIELAAPPSRSLIQRAVETIVSPLPDMARRLASPEMAEKYTALVSANPYDVIQIEGIEMAPYWLADSVLQPMASVVFDDHNAEYVLQQTAYKADRWRLTRLHAALYSYIQWHKLVRFERNLCVRAGHVVAVSEHDADALHALDNLIQPVVIPNGVDIEYFAPTHDARAHDENPLSIVFTGKMDFRPNVDAATWFAQEILPAIRREFAAIQVGFVGQKPSPPVQALSALPGVTVTGWVPDTRPYISDAAVYAVPLRMGGGTRLKVLEAMAMGKAIVSTRLGAEGIDYVRDRDLIIADHPDEFARAVIGLLRDSTRRAQLGANARQLAEDKYDWHRIVPSFESLYTASHA